MAEQLKPDELVTFQELAVSNAYEITALVAVLERKGILMHAEVLGEIARQKKVRPDLHPSPALRSSEET